jgi:hypothetical protein
MALPETKAIPFGGEQSGIDELAGANPAFVNALLDRGNVIRARPGIMALADFPAIPPSRRPVTMIASFGRRIIYTTNDGSVFAWRGPNDVVPLSFSDESRLQHYMTPTWASSGENIFVVVAGGVPQKISASLVSSRLGGDPPAATGVCILTRRIVLAQAGTGNFPWSGILEGGAEDWDLGMEFREAEAKADNLVTVSAAARELYAFGEETVEAYAPDENDTFSPTAALEVGLLAARSLVRWYHQHAWLSDQQQIVMSDCHTFDDDSLISRDIQNQLDQLNVTDDCWSFRMLLGQHDCLTWVFPTEGRVFAYDMTSKAWSQWHGMLGGRMGAWRPTAAYYWREAGIYLVGLPNGMLAQLTFDAHTDLGDSILWRARSGFVTHGSLQPKSPLQVHMQFRRGEATSGDSAVDVSWRDDLGEWAPKLRYPLGTAGDVQPTIEITPAGAPYAQRQWEVSSTAADARAMISARELYHTEGVA